MSPPRKPGVHPGMGVAVPVMPKAQLVAYKQALGRKVHRLDLEPMGGRDLLRRVIPPSAPG